MVLSMDEQSDSYSISTSDINDEEFNIPAFEETPTLESILKEDDQSLISEDELSQLLSSQPWNTFKESDDNLYVESNSLYRDYQNFNTVTGIHEYKYDPGHILRHTTLKAVSAQLKSATDRINAGSPTVIHVSVVISVGTSGGLVLVFDEKQALRWYHVSDQEKSSVSALCFSHDYTRLLAGYANGVILMFDVSDGKLLRTMVDVHTPCTAVLHLKFTDIPTLALCSDSGGSVFELNFTRTLGVRGVDYKCIFSGSKGEVCCIEPLLLNPLNSHPLRGTVIVAMATLTKLIIIRIRPTMKVLQTCSIKADPCCLPLLSWQFVIVQLSDNFRIMDPVLAFARDHSIYFYQVNIAPNRGLKCSALQKFDFNFSLLTCHWLNTRMIACLDRKEQLHLFDIRTKECLETIDLSGVGLVYNSSHFKGLSTGGNVSQAMALAGEQACYNTVQCYGNQILLLGMKSCHVVSIRTWIERLDALVDKGKFECALRLGMEFLEEKGRAITGLSGRHHHRNELIKNKVIEILITYIDSVLNGGTTSVPVANSVNTIINMAVDLENTELLFERMWDGLEYNKDSLVRGIFLQNLAVAVIDEKILHIPPAIMQQLVKLTGDKQMWKELELCILNVNIECLDIQQVLQLSRQYSLHSALISIWNRGMMDYASPLQELLPKLKMFMEKEQHDQARDLGNKLFVYISYCFAGRAYPKGDINESTTESVRNQVFQCICCQHSSNADENEGIYPYLRLLLKFDTKEFLNVLLMSIDDTKFSTQLKQRFTDILILLSFETKSFEVDEIGLIFTFLCKFSKTSSRNRPIHFDEKLYKKVICMLSEPHDPAFHEKRQKVLLDLMLVDNFEHFHEDFLLSCSEKANLEIYQNRGEHDRVLNLYLKDPTMKHDVFSYIERWAAKVHLKPFILEHFKELVNIANERTGLLFAKHFPDLILEVKDQMSPRNLYFFLKGAASFNELDNSLVTTYVQLQTEFCEENEIVEFVHAHNNILLEPALKASKKNNLDRVTSILLERLGNHQEAFDLLLQRLKDTIEKGVGIEDATEELISLMRRRSVDLEPKTTLLPLLQCLSTLNSRDLLKRVLRNADLNLAAELHLLLQNNNGTLGDYRDLISGLFEKCAYDYSMLKALSRTVYSDLHKKLSDAITESKCGVSSPQVCSLCQHSFRSKFVLFRCGHGFHEECANTLGTKCNLCSSYTAPKNCS